MALCTFTPKVNSKKNSELLKFQRDIGTRLYATHRGCSSPQTKNRPKEVITKTSSSFKFDVSGTASPKKSFAPHESFKSVPTLFNQFKGADVNFTRAPSEISNSSIPRTTNSVTQPKSQRIFKDIVEREYQQVLSSIRLSKQRQGLIYDEFEALMF